MSRRGKKYSHLHFQSYPLVIVCGRLFPFLDNSYQDSNRDLRLSKRPEWSEVDWQPPLLDKKDKSEVSLNQKQIQSNRQCNWKTHAKALMIICLSKRDLNRLLNEGSLEGGAGRELRLLKQAFEVVN